MKQVIYETKGRAREFSELACNLFGGCSHRCLYCYAPMVIHKSAEDFQRPQIRVTAQDVLVSAKEWVDRGETRRVLFCFIGDCYDPIEQETMLTRKCIMAMHEVGLNVTLLTKGGLRSMRDFDLLTPKDAYATTLTCIENDDSLVWEPKASLPCERIEALQQAYYRGIETWASLEPVIHPGQTEQLVYLTADVVGHYKLGTMNYHPHRKTIDWKSYGYYIKDVLDRIGAKYYFKGDLLKEMGVLPSEFKQTWIEDDYGRIGI